MYGNKDPKYPWDDADGARFIGNELRAYHPVGIHITWPAPGPQVGTPTTHVVTVWGDDGDPNDLTTNPAQLKIADSDRDDPNRPDNPNIQTYTYDAYDDPSHAIEEGAGWYFDYTPAPHPYIMYAAVLSPRGNETHCQGNVRVVGSYEIKQNEPNEAIGLHYEVATDTQICQYTTTINYEAPDPSIDEHEQPTPAPRGLTVDWDLAADPVPQDTLITITTEFSLNIWNGMEYSDVRFTYAGEKGGSRALPPAFVWSIVTPELYDPNVYVPGMASGFVVGAFDLYDDPNGTNLVGRYRFEHQYAAGYDPEHHDFRLEARDGSSFYVGNLRFGHRWVYTDADALWALDVGDWMPVAPPVPNMIAVDPTTPYELAIDWSDLLPYPTALCWGPARPCVGDCNCDGLVDFGDINPFVAALLNDVYCDEIGINADVSGNGSVGFDDINPFVGLLTGGPLPVACP